MSVSMTKTDGVTVMTLTSDPKSACSPLCQIFKALCYSPVCCSVSQQLRRVQKTSQSALGALQIMVGWLNIVFAAILWCGHGPWWIMDIMFPFWLGGSVIINVILNLTGVGFAITAIVLYSISVAESDWELWGKCRDYSYNYWYGHHARRTASPSPEKLFMQEKCLEAQALILMLIRSMNAVMIILSALELCLVISSVVLGIKALKSSQKGENKSTDEPEHYKPLLEEVTTYPVV
ncbi:uncharacterized protein LOC128367089 isoform X2 [Scomber scombrus]|uniref:Uncharacterized protein LOC128367089 isoform X2 n=1 Tax=Scomber scombrus TaxID=13677 RepID=A0AAV1NIZ7_SCOSC